MINIHFCLNFIKHYWSATRIDVLHSPFVFDLYNSCVKPKNSNADLDSIEKLRSMLKEDQRIINQLDLGAGAQSSSLKQKSIAQFATQHAKPARIAQIMYRLVKHSRYKHIVELGTSLGISSCYLASAVKSAFAAAESHITTIEGAPEIAAIASENSKQLGLDNYIQQRIGNFDDVLPDILKSYQEIDMAFIDGNHRYQPTVDYFHQFLPYMRNDSMIIFDDIYWSKGMTQAWEEIKQHPRVTVTVDLFFIGLVFFRKEQVKEHFKLRVL
jgi:predicted O-methyltransferase YrrM